MRTRAVSFKFDGTVAEAVILRCNVVRGCSLCGLLVRTHAQRFGKDREMKVLRYIWQLELEIVRCLIPDLCAFDVNTSTTYGVF
jgi:hypothetical protein